MNNEEISKLLYDIAEKGDISAIEKIEDPIIYSKKIFEAINEYYEKQ